MMKMHVMFFDPIILQIFFLKTAIVIYLYIAKTVRCFFVPSGMNGLIS